MDAKAVMFLTVILLFVANAYAIGISPARTFLNFTPSMEAALGVTVINNENRTYDARVYVRGDLAQYVDIDAATVTLGPHTSRRFNYTLKLPSWLAGPKTYDTRIGAVESASGSSMLGAVAGVEAQLWIVVPDLGPRPAVVDGELPPIGQVAEQPSPEQEQPGEEQPSGQPPIEQESGQPIPTSVLGTILVFIGSVLGVTTLVAYIIVTKAGHPQRRRNYGKAKRP